MQLLEGRKAVVTGGSRGIGREICLLLAENGADVALAYRKSTVEAEQLREEIAAMGRSCIAVQADVSVSADVDRFVTQAAQALGGIDILVNCAGVFPQALIEDITDEDWSRVMRINLDGAFYACRAAAPYLKKSGKNGRIINLSSQAALNGTAHGVHYGASKAALLGLTYCLAKELGPDGITVNAMHPGAVASGFKNGAAGLARTLVGGFYAVFGISPEKGADTILHLAGSPEVADVTGEYFVKRRPATTSKACRDAETRRRLWEVSEELVPALDEPTA